MFEEVIDDFADYYRAYTSAGVENFEQTAGMEVLRRLRHLDYLLQEVEWRCGLLSLDLDIGSGQVEPAGIDALVRRFQSASRCTTRRLADLGQLEIELSEQIEMLVESFYFHAHRLLKLLQKGPLPGFNVLEAKGVLLVRNQLIEHFPQRNRTWPASHTLDFSDTAAGPKLTKSNDPVVDAGLLINASELRDAVTACLRTLPQDPAPPGSPGAFGGTWWAEERRRQVENLRSSEP